MRVENILSAASKCLVTVRDDAPLAVAAKLLLEADADLLVVCNAARRMAGVISKTDVVRQIGRRPDGEGMPVVSAVMTRTVVSCKPGEQLHDVWTTMKDRRLKNLPILDQDFDRSAWSTRGTCSKLYSKRSSMRKSFFETT